MEIDPYAGVRCVWFWRRSTGDEFRTVWTFMNATTESKEVTAEDFATVMVDWWNVIDQDIASTVEIYYTKLEQIGSFATDGHNHSPVWQGLSSADMLPPQMAALMIGYADIPRGIAKKYIPGYVETMQAGGVLTSGAENNLQALADLWEDGVTIDDTLFAPAIFHTATGVMYQVHGCVARPLMATQRRRKAGVGR